MTAPPPLRADRSYAPLEVLTVPNAVDALRLTACGDALDSGPCGPEEHRIDAFQVRNEAAFINDFRDDVTDCCAARRARRRPNCSGLSVIIEGRVHKVLYTKCPVPASREILLDYGENYWDAWRKGGSDVDSTPGVGDINEASNEHDQRTIEEGSSAEISEVERFEPLDRTGARAAVGDEELWEWAKCGAPPPPSTLDLEPATCHTSVSALDPARSYEEVEVVLPDFYRSQFTPEIRDKLLAAVRYLTAMAVSVQRIRIWLASGHGAPSVVLGKLLSSAHPAVAAAEAYASLKEGVASVQLGLFAQRDLPAYQVVCEYQGVRLTSPVGCSPWRSAPPAGRGAYMVACTQGEVLCGGMRTSLRMLPSRRSFGYAHKTPGIEPCGGDGCSAAAQLWCDEWLEWVERLECEIDEMLKSDEDCDAQHKNDDQEEKEEDEKESDDDDDDDDDDVSGDADGVQFEIAWLMARFEMQWDAEKQQAKRASLIAKYGLSLALELARERYEQSRDAAETRQLAVQAARRRRLWMAQLKSFAVASPDAREAVLNLLPTVAGMKVTKERSVFTWCVKYDPLTPAPANLKEMPQTVLDGVLNIYAVYGLTVPPACLQTCVSKAGSKSSLRSIISQHVYERLPRCGVTPWCQVLDPALAGLRHSSDPNAMLNKEGRLVAIRALDAGEHVTCDFNGFMRLRFSQPEQTLYERDEDESIDSILVSATIEDGCVPTNALLDALAITIHAAADVCANDEPGRHKLSRLARRTLPPDWVARRLHKLAAELKCHWGLHAARAALLRMSYENRNSAIVHAKTGSAATTD